MPELINCRRCHKVFTFIAGLPICPDCVKEEEKIFEEVSEYLRNNPGTPLAQVAEELDISYEKLMKYVREGRLQIKAPNGKYISFCEKCGKETAGGRFCLSCEGHILNVLDTSKKNLQTKVADKSQGGYRFLATDEKKGAGKK